MLTLFPKVAKICTYCFYTMPYDTIVAREEIEANSFLFIPV